MGFGKVPDGHEDETEIPLYAANVPSISIPFGYLQTGRRYATNVRLCRELRTGSEVVAPTARCDSSWVHLNLLTGDGKKSWEFEVHVEPEVEGEFEFGGDITIGEHRIDLLISGCGMNMEHGKPMLKAGVRRIRTAVSTQ